VFYISIWRTWSFVWGISPPKPLRGDGTETGPY